MKCCRTMCDLTNSDMEVQRCELKFGSWVYNALQLDLLNVSQFIIKPEIMIDCPLINFH